MITIVVHNSQFGISDKKRPKISCNPFIYYSFEPNYSGSEKLLHNSKEKPRNKAKKQIYEPSL